MAKDMLINVSEGEECRIALVEGGALEELYMERTSSTSHVGNVYKGKVMNVEPSIQAAFVDFGLGRNGFLHISDLLPSYFGRKGDDVQEFVGKKMARRDRPPIQRCLRRGDEIVVQVIKEGIGTKGPTLSAYLSISGKMLVMMPGVNGRGVSRKIEDEDERRRLKQILDQLDPPEDCGFIIRTESVGKSKVEIERDLKYLARLWEQIKKKRDSKASPLELYTEGDLVTRTVRDVFSSDVDRIIIDNEEVAGRVSDVIKLSNPRAKNKVELYDGPLPLFHKFGIEREIEQMYSRHVPLKSGGSLVIDSTEAIVAIDVNSGKFRDHSDAETTAYKTDMEAADEICRQLKLRDLGGVIIVDFIDLRYERHRRDLEERLEENLKRDRAKTKVLRMSQFGIVEMTRQRMRPSLKRSVYFDCPHCKGAGLVKTPESMSLDVMRRLAIGIHDARVTRVELSVNPDVSFYLLNKKRGSLAQLEYDTGRKILIRSDAKLGLDEMRLELFDIRDGVVMIQELASLQQVPHKTQLNTRPAGGAPQNRGPRREERQAGRPGQRPGGQQQNRNRPEEEEREDFDRDMEAIESRDDEFDGENDREHEHDRGLDRVADHETDHESDHDGEVDHEQRNDSRATPAGDRGQPQRRPGNDRPGGPPANRDGGRPFVANKQNNNSGPNNGPPRDPNAPHRDAQDAEMQEGEGGGKRRRRRRRRRGRGRAGQGADGQPLPQGAPGQEDAAGEFEDGGVEDHDVQSRGSEFPEHDEHEADHEEAQHYGADEAEGTDGENQPHEREEVAAENRGQGDANDRNDRPRDGFDNRQQREREDRQSRGRDNRQGQGRDNRQPRNDRPQQDRDNRQPRNDRPQQDRDNRQPRNDRPQQDRDNRQSRNDRPQQDRDNRQARNDRPAQDRDDRQAREDRQRQDRDSQRDRDAFDAQEDLKDREVLDERNRREAGAARGDVAPQPVENAELNAGEDRFDAIENVEHRGEESESTPPDSLFATPPAEVAETPEAEAPKGKKGTRRGASGGAKKKPAGKAAKAAPAAKAPASADEAKPKRGGRAARAAAPAKGRGRVAKAKASESVPASAKSAGGTSRKAAEAAETPIVRTGSTDSHLADEEPVTHEPVRRPRSFRDLDQIPEDYDD